MLGALPLELLELTCIPEAVLGKGGYFPKKQKTLESLSLISGGTFRSPSTYRPLCPSSLDLASLTNLRYLSWKGPMAVLELEALRDFFAVSLKTLEKLDIDLIDWSGVTLNWKRFNRDFDRDYGNVFAQCVLEVNASDFQKVFSALKSLSLSAVSFEDATVATVRVFNITHLRSLKLHNCPGVLTLMDSIVDLQQPLSLTFLELDIDDTHEGGGSAIVRFLRVFHGLAEFRMMLFPSMSSEVYWEAIMHHRSTLRKFVYHERKVQLDDSCPHYNCWSDDEVTWEPSMQELFIQADLQCLGLSCGLDELISNIQSHAAAQPLELLHIRSAPGYFDAHDFGPKYVCLKMYAGAWIEDKDAMLDFAEWVNEQAIRAKWDRENDADSETSSVSSLSEPEFGGIVEHAPWAYSIVEFAEWAFGPRGLPSLQILAVGDFSYPFGVKYRYDNVLFHRKRSRPSRVTCDIFELVVQDHAGLLESLGLSIDFLTACPTERILMSSGGRPDFPG